MESPPFGHQNECSFKSTSTLASNFRPLVSCSTYRHGGGHEDVIGPTAFGDGILPVSSWKSQCFRAFDAHRRSIWINNLFSTHVPRFLPSLSIKRLRDGATSFALSVTNLEQKKNRITDTNCGQEIIVSLEKKLYFTPTRPKAPTYVPLLPNGPAYAICRQWWGQLVACGFD